MMGDTTVKQWSRWCLLRPHVGNIGIRKSTSMVAANLCCFCLFCLSSSGLVTHGNRSMMQRYHGPVEIAVRRETSMERAQSMSRNLKRVSQKGITNWYHKRVTQTCTAYMNWWINKPTKLSILILIRYEGWWYLPLRSPFDSMVNMINMQCHTVLLLTCVARPEAWGQIMGGTGSPQLERWMIKVRLTGPAQGTLSGTL